MKLKHWIEQQQKEATKKATKAKAAPRKKADTDKIDNTEKSK